MNITHIAFKYRKTVFFILTLLLINGVFAYFTLPAQEDPTITIRESVISTSFPGMAPERVEQLITKKLEEEIRKVPEVKEIRSLSTTGNSTIHVKIHDRYFNLDDIWQDVRNKAVTAHTKMPSGTSTPYVNTEFGDVSVVTLALTADGFDMSAMYDIAQHIRDTLYSVEGTKKIEILGHLEERIFLEASNARLSQLGISPQALINELQKQNIIRSGGEVDTGKKSFIIEPSGNFGSVPDIANTYINIPNTEDFIALKDVVSIKRDYIDPPDKLAYYNGKPAIYFAISMLPQYNILEFAPRIKTNINKVIASLPIGYQLDIATYQAEQVEKTVQGVSINVLQTLAIVLVVVVLFLGLRTGLIVGAIVPFVMLTTLSIMLFFDMKLERMSLATLIISLGLLVDNGIVIAEDFKRRIEDGISRFDAMLQGCKELAIPLLSSSITTILFFLPLMLAEHVAGEFTRSISLVILITLMTSWILALCVTPILCYYFIKPSKAEIENSLVKGKLSTMYEGFLHSVLKHRLIFISIILILFVGAIGSMKFVAKQFFPESDRTQILMYIDLPNGTSSRETNRQMKDIFTWLDNKEKFAFIENYSGYVGFNGPRFVLSLNPEDPAQNKGFIVLNVVEGTDVAKRVSELGTQLEAKFPNISARVKKMFLGPSDAKTIKIQVKGPDKNVIYQKAQQIMDLLHQVPNTINIRNDWENLIVKIDVKIDQHRAKRASLTSSEIADALQTYFSGAQITEYREGDEIIPIILRAQESERNNLDKLRTLNVYSEKTGKAIPLFQVATFVPVNQFSVIHHEDMFRTISIEARNTGMAAEDLQKVIDEKIQLLAADLPVNHEIFYGGAIKESKAAQKALSASMPMVIGFILILLVAQFNSFRKAAIITLTMPLSFIGAVIGLLVMQAPFGFMVTLGLYSLAGIIINNAIVLIDRINIEVQSGKTQYQALVDACLTRLRPIAMTTITTVMGLLPLIISKDPLFYGMANVIAFGLGIGTILTLAVVPVLYSTFYKVKAES
ncbi:efflux RND transporter permease subunit [Colwellia sp. 1_MG-2023]|uniref:efflux RND transporter permease subunit n=1 Tax=unclassified Colwellia TaxID=196834 RepID=UPI001C0A4886|nr:MULTISPECIES: efflux RND transporter permease subunit [unclassified Colwellia]MBU2925573.1 efflux RND transporter permease subunit [Colwellia sp. C2M11]MDO6651458.1 efflux RND transporter permease subunit [Colwellia sp. 3_MG-2023]MDO6666813.1 efflux RND transporter permease subunit [Colwellia sp. 2_MG-2023]MDO6690967.1 efflux RND transporter permease subunit [Colwellia sp. 1_MG-2023]